MTTDTRLTPAQRARAVVSDLTRNRADADTERATWAGLLGPASPADRLEIAQAAWIDLRAYGYDPQTGERA